MPDARDHVSETTRQLADSALRKLGQSQSPTAREEEALAKVRRVHEENQRWQYYHSIPKRHWKSMAGGIQEQTINRQARVYGFPIGQATINLEKFVYKFHRFLADNQYILRDGQSDKPDANARYMAARAERFEMEVAQRRGQLVDVHVMGQTLQLLCECLRRANATIKQRGFKDAHEILEKALVTFERLLGQRFPHLAGEDQAKPPATSPNRIVKDGGRVSPKPKKQRRNGQKTKEVRGRAES